MVRVQKEGIFPSLHKTASTYSMLDGVYIAELILGTNAFNKKLTFVHCLHCFHARVSSLHLSISFTLQINSLHLSNSFSFFK